MNIEGETALKGIEDIRGGSQRKIDKVFKKVKQEQ